MKVQVRAILGALLLAALPGCLGDRTSSSASWLHRFRPFKGVDDPDAVYLDVALVQIPYADLGRYADLWSFIDEGGRVVPLEKKGALEENGFRVGQVSGNPPPELLELLTQQRTCPEPRRIQLVAGQEERSLEIGSPHPTLSCEVSQNGQATRIELEKAQCCLNIAPSFAGEAQIHLAIGSKVKHTGKGKAPWKPRSDRTGWMLNLAQAVEGFPQTGFEVTLAPGEYVIVGARLDRPGTLAHRTFVRPDEAAPVQRLLVLRAWRPRHDSMLPGNTDEPRTGPVPLAVQASFSSVREAAP